MRGTLIIWLGALVLFGIFHVWYGGWRGPLTPQEVEKFLEEIDGIEAYRGQPEARDRIRAFLLGDDGREFFMVNVWRLREAAEPVAGSTQSETPQELLNRYSTAFLPEIASRAGWLVAAGRAASPDLERWGVAPEADWQMFGLVRYRSRRDLIEVVTNEKFHDIHPFKFAAIEATRAFPVAPALIVFGPRLVLGLVLLVLALTAQLLVNRWGRRS